MTNDILRQFDLHFPGNWIDDADREWAFSTLRVLKIIESLFIEAVAAYSRFIPVTSENYQTYIEGYQSPYERCLNGIYAKTFVFALDSIEKLLSSLCEHLSPPGPIRKFCQNYKNQFRHLKHIRDSAIHIEDRGRGKTRRQKDVNTNVLILGSFIERRFFSPEMMGKKTRLKFQMLLFLRRKISFKRLLTRIHGYLISLA